MATLNAGSGADGNATVTGSININTDSLVGRGYADMISYNCSSVGSNSCVATTAPDGIVAGDEVLLINLQGVSGYYNQVGNYETFTVDNINVNTITFSTDKSKFYGDTGTSDACEGGTASASDYASGDPASDAFDNNTATSWRCLNISGNWIKYEMAAANTIVRYSLTNGSWVAGSFTAWRLQGSNNDVDWTTLDTRSGVTSWSSIETKTYDCTTDGSYLYYRILVDGVIDSGGDGMMSEIQMFDATDTNIGILTTNQRVMVQRIPQYTDLTIDNGTTLSCDVFDKVKGGVLYFRASGTITNNGTISAAESGNEGGYANAGENGAGDKGDSLIVSPGTGAPNNIGGGAGGATSHGTGYGGAGGGYGVAAADAPTAAGGAEYGEETLTELHLGSGGGGGGHNDYGGGTSNPPGGFGGGAIALFTSTFHNYGFLDCNGADSDPSGQANTVGGGGGGSGGSILIHAGTLWTHSSTTLSEGGLKSIGSNNIGTDGAVGRIAISYATVGDSIAGVSPTPYTDDTLELPFSISGTASAACTVRVYDASWVFVKAQAVSTGAYQISNLPNAGPFNVVSDPDSVSNNIISYKGVTPTQ